MEDANKRLVVEAVTSLEGRTRAIIARIDGRRSLGRFEKDELQAVYSMLKDNVKSAAKRPRGEIRAKRLGALLLYPSHVEGFERPACQDE